MKERRAAGATHSFRLTMRASRIVDAINHPRTQGGKSKKVSDAIEWFFSSPTFTTEYNDNGERTGKLVRSQAGVVSPEELVVQWENQAKTIAALNSHIENLESGSPTPPRSIIFRVFQSLKRLVRRP